VPASAFDLRGADGALSQNLNPPRPWRGGVVVWRAWKLGVSGLRNLVHHSTGRPDWPINVAHEPRKRIPPVLLRTLKPRPVRRQMLSRRLALTLVRRSIPSGGVRLCPHMPATLPGMKPDWYPNFFSPTALNPPWPFRVRRQIISFYFRPPACLPSVLWWPDLGSSLAKEAARKGAKLTKNTVSFPPGASL